MLTCRMISPEQWTRAHSFFQFLWVLLKENEILRRHSKTGWAHTPYLLECWRLDRICYAMIIFSFTHFLTRLYQYFCVFSFKGNQRTKKKYASGYELLYLDSCPLVVKGHRKGALKLYVNTWDYPTLKLKQTLPFLDRISYCYSQVGKYTVIKKCTEIGAISHMHTFE